ncbi:ImmA/IrrE family metallo-endopeptidase [Macrococcus capreoli]
MQYTYYEIFNDFVRSYFTSIDLKTYVVPHHHRYDIQIESLCKAKQFNIAYGSSPTEKFDQLTFTIRINDGLDDKEQRYALAKRLGYFLTRHITPSIIKKDKTQIGILKKNQEILANKFAREILMPRNLLLVLLSKYAKEQTDMERQEIFEQLSDDLCVPLELVMQRMEEERLLD